MKNNSDILVEVTDDIFAVGTTGITIYVCFVFAVRLLLCTDDDFLIYWWIWFCICISTGDRYCYY